MYVTYEKICRRFIRTIHAFPEVAPIFAHYGYLSRCDVCRATHTRRRRFFFFYFWSMDPRERVKRASRVRRESWPFVRQRGKVARAFVSFINTARDTRSSIV